jgi:uncharacterized protein (DUF1697 family)
VTAYVALLRGLNVGGKNLVPMTALRACFERQGLREVATYIQSGNVLFSAPARPGAAALASRLERAVAADFGVTTLVVLRTAAQLRAVVEAAPAGFGRDAARYRYDVLFLKDPGAAGAALAEVPVQEGVDRAEVGPGVLYFSRVAARAARSRLSRITALALYQRLTIRNWNTTTKLLALLTAREPAAHEPRPARP